MIKRTLCLILSAITVLSGGTYAAAVDSDETTALYSEVTQTTAASDSQDEPSDTEETEPADDRYEGMDLINYNGSPLGQYVAHEAFGVYDSAAIFMRIKERATANHEHSDAGTFEIYYKGNLAIDSCHCSVAQWCGSNNLLGIVISLHCGARCAEECANHHCNHHQFLHNLCRGNAQFLGAHIDIAQHDIVGDDVLDEGTPVMLFLIESLGIIQGYVSQIAVCPGLIIVTEAENSILESIGAAENPTEGFLIKGHRAVCACGANRSLGPALTQHRNIRTGNDAAIGIDNAEDTVCGILKLNNYTLKNTV